MTIEEQLAAEQKAHAATKETLTKAEADTKAAVERAEKAEAALKTATDAQGAVEAKVTALEGDKTKVAEENAKLKEENQKLAGENKTLAAKEQDISKRANAQFREFCGAMGIKAPNAPSADQPGNGTPSATATKRATYGQLLAEGKTEEAGKYWAEHKDAIRSGK